MFSVHGKQPTNSQALVKNISRHTKSLEYLTHIQVDFFFGGGSNIEKHVRSPEFMHPGMLIERSMNNQAYPETKTISSDE